MDITVREFSEHKGFEEADVSKALQKPIIKILSSYCYLINLSQPL